MIQPQLHLRGATPTNFVDGFVDDFRFSLGVNRESLVSFDPPTVQYTPDIYDSLLLHMDGSDGGTTFVDSTGNFTPTVNGTIVTKTSDGAINPVVGSAMSKATATPGYLSFPDSDLFNYSTVDFTVEGYVNLDDIRVHSVLYDQRDSGFSGFGLVFGLSADETMMVQFDTVALARVQLLTAPLNISTDVWYHWCAMRDGETLYFFLDGHMIESKDIGSVQLYNSSGTVYIGFNQFGNGNIDGRMDEVRVSKGIGRFSIANFTPPTGEEYSGTNRLKYYNGSAWVAKPVKYYNGSAWVTKQLKYYNGSSWT